VREQKQVVEVRPLAVDHVLEELLECVPVHVEPAQPHQGLLLNGGLLPQTLVQSHVLVFILGGQRRQVGVLLLDVLLVAALQCGLVFNRNSQGLVFTFLGLVVLEVDFLVARPK